MSIRADFPALKLAMPEQQELHPLSSPAPAQPAVVMRLLDLLAGEAHLSEDCMGVWRLDPALTLWAMTIAAQKTQGGHLPTLGEALNRIGLAGLKTHVLQEALELLVVRQPPADRLQAWRQTLRCAFLCDTLARALSYPHPHEAYLAGLLHNLGPIPPAGWDLDHLLQERDAALAERIESWRYPSLLPDALRYQHWPLAALRDAAAIVQILWAARSLAEQDGRATEVEIAALLDLAPDRLAELLPHAYADAELALNQFLSGPQSVSFMQEAPIQLHRSLSRFVLLEELARAVGEGRVEGSRPAALALHLVNTHGLSAPLYLRHDASLGRLVNEPLPGQAAPPTLSVPVEGSDTVAAMAFQWHRAIGTITVNQGGASLLDTQLARLAGREGILAIPIGEDHLEGVLVACGYRGQITNLTEDAGYLDKLGRIAARTAQEPEQAAGEPSDEQGGFGQLRARQLAHEINNPLGIIKNYLALLRVKLGEDAATSDELRVIHEELDRIARIVQALVTESLEPLASDTEVDVNGLLADLVKVAAAGLMLQKHIRVDLHFEEGLPRIACERDKLKQLLLNLLLNAIEASPEHGVVSVETHRIINHRLEQQLEILVSNSGPEIAPALLARLFEPLESTKGKEHAGLGLSIVRSLAADLRASVTCRSQRGITTFQILLPMRERTI